MTKDELKKETKDTLIIWLLNSECQRLRMGIVLDKLTGCSQFGECDGTNGCCVECSYEQPELWQKCHDFRFDIKSNL